MVGVRQYKQRLSREFTGITQSCSPFWSNNILSCWRDPLRQREKVISVFFTIRISPNLNTIMKNKSPDHFPHASRTPGVSESTVGSQQLHSAHVVGRHCGTVYRAETGRVTPAQKPHDCSPYHNWKCMKVQFMQVDPGCHKFPHRNKNSLGLAMSEKTEGTSIWNAGVF